MNFAFLYIHLIVSTLVRTIHFFVYTFLDMVIVFWQFFWLCFEGTLIFYAEYLKLTPHFFQKSIDFFWFWSLWIALRTFDSILIWFLPIWEALRAKDGCFTFLTGKRIMSKLFANQTAEIINIAVIQILNLHFIYVFFNFFFFCLIL